LRDSVQQINLKAQGLGSIAIPFSGFSFPTVVGPFDYFDLRATLTQTVADMTALNNYRSAKQVARANQYSAQDARDLVVLTVGGAYLQVITAQARLDSARAQLETASALYKQTSQQRSAGLVSLTDVNRSHVQVLVGQQRLVTIQNDLAKQKINLARLTGLPANESYEISDTVPFSPAPSLTVEDALKQAFDRRPDLKAAGAQIRAAELARSAARAERLPSLSVGADYGAIGTNPSQAHGTFSAAATLRFPLWQGGRTEGDIEQADAALDQRKAELQDLRGRLESDVRNAYLDLTAAASQVEVARQNLDVTGQTLDLTRQRFEAGVTDNVEVVQAQESVANAELDYINSVFAHNIAKLSLAPRSGRRGRKPAAFLETAMIGYAPPLVRSGVILRRPWDSGL
ncbi:MAG: TolC family protein, partial [Bryobacteraceae bacterium]